MYVTKIEDYLRDMGIEAGVLNPDCRLGEDLAMDSQEVLELVALLERDLQVKLPKGVFGRNVSVASLDRYLTEAKAPRPEAAPEKEGSGFQYSCSTEEVIRASREDVYRALFDMRDWPNRLPHVQAIDVLYDDGQYQEFRMDVQSRDGILKVRSIRNCRGPDRIDFFQPEPPDFLLHHAGGWHLQETEEGFCRVTATHHWNPKPDAGQAPGGRTTGDYTDLLLGHAKSTLGCWKRILEGKEEGVLHG